MNLPTLSRNDILERKILFNSSTHRGNLGSGEVKLEKVSRMCRRKRRGAAAVEFAVVAPLFFLLIFGMIEFGRIIMVQQIITNASREGARVGVLDPPPGGTTRNDVLTKVNNYLSAAKITGASTTITPTEPSTATYGQSVTVTVQVPFNNISWLPHSWFGNTGKTFQATTVMRRETVQ